MPRRRYVSRRLAHIVPPVAELSSRTALSAIREIGNALVRADRPDDVFQFALDRVSPVVGASFASVYLLDGAAEEMRLVAAHNWPEKHRPWLAAVRMRLGFGPSGEAASERRVIEIPDVLSDPGLDDWHEVARELEFHAVVALPLQAAGGVLGTVTFYFRRAGSLAPEMRTLLGIVADHMAATADKARVADEMRRANAALAESTAELERQYVAVVDARRGRDELFAHVSYELRAAMSAVVGFHGLLREEVSGPLTSDQRDELQQAADASRRLLELIDSLLEYTALKKGTLDLGRQTFDPREPLREAMSNSNVRPQGVTLVADEPAGGLPTVTSDQRRVSRILAQLIARALRSTVRGEVRVTLAVAGESVEYGVRDMGGGIDAAEQLRMFDEDLPDGGGIGLALSRDVARLLGGDITVRSVLGEGTVTTLLLPLVAP